MNKHRRKICCHCGSETHPQPQDHDHDLGYGHCERCLTKDDWYKKNVYHLNGDRLLFIFESRPYVNGPLTSDDSHPKVVELWEGGKVKYHQTLHRTKDEILSHFNK